MLAARAAETLRELGMEVYAGSNQLGTLSFRSGEDCEEAAERLSGKGIAVRAGLHCAPLAHRSAGTIRTGTVRVSTGPDTCGEDLEELRRAVQTSLRPFRE